MIKHDGKYYLTYSANFFASPSYSLGYAVSDTPLGTFVKAQENPLLTSGLRRDVSGTGHHSFTVSPDGSQLWAVYHSHTDLTNPGGNRKVNIDRAGFTSDGRLFISGPTTSLQPHPSGISSADVTPLFRAYSGSMETRTQDAPSEELLTDGLFSVSTRHAWIETELTAQNGIVQITLISEEKLPICGIAVYPGIDHESDIAAIRLRAGEKSLSEEFAVNADASLPLLLYFDAYETDTIELSLSLREGLDHIPLSEISILSEKK